MGDDNSDVDVELLTEEIKTRREIWDIRNEHYKDRIKKHSAWEKICGLLIKDFNEKKENENKCDR